MPLANGEVIDIDDDLPSGQLETSATQTPKPNSTVTSTAVLNTSVNLQPSPSLSSQIAHLSDEVSIVKVNSHTIANGGPTKP